MIKDLIVIENSQKRSYGILKPKIVYGYEALCGWCYGFSDELNKAVSILKSEVDFELINCGLFVDNKEAKMELISGHIKNNMQFVTDKTGKEFGKGFLDLLENKEYPYNSMKASIAIEVIKELIPEKVFDFAAKIQKAFFYYGCDVHCDETYLSIINEYNIDESRFIENIHSEVYANKVRSLFYESIQYQFSGYPASAVKKEGQVKKLIEGFFTAEQYVKLVRKELF